jgi:3-dehydroquinate synthase
VAVLDCTVPKFSMKNINVKSIRVRSGAGDYFVRVGPGLLNHCGREIGKLGDFSSLHAVSSPKVWKALGKRTRDSLSKHRNSHVHLFDDAEAQKNLKSVELLARKLVRAGADRRALLLAVGGGVVGDVAGFVAASYLRGVSFVQVPTTVVAQVDSAVGGKTGVNLPEGKNLVGAFFPARLVLIDPDVLASLPGREFRGGLAEVIKYGVIADAKLFAFLERNFEAILARDAAALQHIIQRSLEIKAEVVGKDERESGLREILNFGHTFGHALESVTQYKRYQHGEAVAWGMMCAAMLGHERGLTSPEDVARIVSLVRRMGSLPPWPAGRSKELLKAMWSDKKARGGKLRFVLANRIGKAATYADVPEKTVESVLRFAPQLTKTTAKLPGKFNG